MSDVIGLREEKGIGIITIDNPPANSLSADVVSGLKSVLDKVLNSPTIRVVIITGSGEAIFVSGANIKELVNLDSAGGMKLVSGVKEVFAMMRLSPKPVFCALNGHVLGGGLELALHCDFRVATEKARFGQPEINLGVLPGAGGTQLLPRLIGLSKARWLLLSGETISARDALACGLVDKVVNSDVLMKETEKMAQKIAEKAPLAIEAIKETLELVENPGLEEAMQRETELFGRLCATEDKEEGVSAFLEKRKALFKGK